MGTQTCWHPETGESAGLLLSVTHASGRETGIEVAGLTDRGEVEAPWWQK